MSPFARGALCGGVALLAACDTKSNASKISGYLVTSACAPHADQASCTADSANQCEWRALSTTCPAGTSCPTVLCAQVDGCTEKQTEQGCEAAGGCAWSRAELLCPVGSTCWAGGYCHTAVAGNGCGCVSPAYCPAGSACPPMECDCSGGSGGGSCTCACPSCLPGEACPPCDCTCAPTPMDGGDCVVDGTCACACPACEPGQSCPPCSCGCVAGGGVSSGGTGGDGAGSATTCTCPACPVGASCPPCSCELDAGSPADPCAKHGEAPSCTADTANGCEWFALGMPCEVGQPCRSGVCQRSTGSGEGCVCACPGCAPGESCLPCSCSCDGASDGGSCTPPAPPVGPVCPAIGCYPQCVNGVKEDANGCGTCECN